VFGIVMDMTKLIFLVMDLFVINLLSCCCFYCCCCCRASMGLATANRYRTRCCEQVSHAAAVKYSIHELPPNRTVTRYLNNTSQYCTLGDPPSCTKMTFKPPKLYYYSIILSKYSLQTNM